MSFGAVAGAVVGGVLSSNAAGDASDAQAGAAAATDATNRYIFNEQKRLQEPFRQTGLQANNRLAYLMGLDPGTGGGSAGAAAPTYEQLRAELSPQFMKRPGGGSAMEQFFTDFPFNGEEWLARQQQPATLDEAGLNAAIQQRMSQYQPQTAGDPNDPEYGSLMRRFGMEDFEADPGYQFRMTEGMRGVEGSAAARGGLLSGAAQKAIQKYGQGLASQEYGNAYNRFTGDQTNQYNRLAGLVNTGQGATNQVSNAAGQFAQNSASNNAALGNAQAAGAIGQANAWNNAIGQGVNAYQQNNLLKQIQSPGGFYPYGGSSFDAGNMS